MRNLFFEIYDEKNKLEKELKEVKFENAKYRNFIIWLISSDNFSYSKLTTCAIQWEKSKILTRLKKLDMDKKYKEISERKYNNG